MKRIVFGVIFFVIIVLSFTGCSVMLDEGKYPFSTDDEVKAALEEKYEQEVTYIKQLESKEQIRYWEFGLENHPDKVFQTYQRKNVEGVFTLAEFTFIGREKEVMDPVYGVTNVGSILLQDYFTAFLETRTQEEAELAIRLFNYSVDVRVDEKEQIETALLLLEKFHQYLDANTNKVELDGSHLSYRVIKDFRNPQKGSFEDDRFGQHTVKIYFTGSITDEERQSYTEELVKKWDEFEANPENQ